MPRRRRPPPDPRPRRQVVVGVVRRPFGLRGDVYVHPDPDLGEEFPVGRRYATEAHGTLTVVASMLHRGLRVVRFAEVRDRDAAAALYGTQLRRDALATDVDRETLWSDELIGATVYDDAGRAVGVVTDVSDGAAHDYLVITDPQGRSVWVPAVAELVSVEDGVVTVHPIPGLLDPDADS